MNPSGWTTTGRRAVAVRIAAIVVGLLAVAGTATPTAHAEASGTAQLRTVVINGIGELAKMLREIEARRKKPPTSDWDVRLLQVEYLGPVAIKNDIVPKIRRARGHAGLEGAAIGFFTQMACWGIHSSHMIGWAGKGNRIAAERESNAASACLRRARVAQDEVGRLLRVTR